MNAYNVFHNLLKLLSHYSLSGGILYTVSSAIGLCLILLTYKGKVLLLQQENLLDPQNNNSWHFIKKLKPKELTPEKAIIQEVHRETHIKLDEVTLLSSVMNNDVIQYLFHAKLSDKHVNNIERAEGRILQFFGLNELSKLQIQQSTKSFFSSNQASIKRLSI